MRDRRNESMYRNLSLMVRQEENQPTGYQGINVNEKATIEFNKIKLHSNTLDDAIYKLGDLNKANPALANKVEVLKAINNNDLPKMRQISDFFYKISGIYARILRYMAFIYRYDWFVTPYTYQERPKAEDKLLLKNFYNSLSILDNFGVKKTLGEIALKVLQHGVYYGYKVEGADGITLQELAPNYCRSRFYCGKKPAVEFNMKFFDDYFSDATTRMKMLDLFPKEFKKGYALYKKGKLKPESAGDTNGWYLLNPKNTVKFNANAEEYPAFISVIPHIIDLDEAQALDKKKTLQRLLKIVIQKMPLDKNGNLVFDPDEIQDLHNNAVFMLQRAIGVDVLTTFADVDVADMEASRADSQSDDLARTERQLFNEAGVSQKQFNTDGNLALEKSILNDEATMYNLLLQFEQFLNELLQPFNKKKVEYKVQILTTTIYNYKELAKLYKEQTQLGYSKFLPQIALGQSQSSILANAYFENDVLDLVNVFIPPLMSSTMNSDMLNRRAAGSSPDSSKEGPGRKELEADEKSDKTILNEESQG